MDEMELEMKSIHNPIFIICTGRSGSTLLQYILDAHDMIDAPQELHMGQMIQEMTRVTGLLHEGRFPKNANQKELVKTEVRSQVERLMRSVLNKEIWCDKSISSIDYLDDIMSVFPKARYIFLYRDCLDFVHSALEVSKYGYNGFWFEDFILKEPKNIVDGLVNFWCMQSEKRIALQKQPHFAIHPIKYEDIVKNTNPTLHKLFDFLGLSFQEEMLDNLFTKFKIGKGDLKVQSLSKIQDNTGKGKYVPLKHIKDDSFNRMNTVLKQIGYDEVDRDFNFSTEGISHSDDLYSYCSKQIFDRLSARLKVKEVPAELELESIKMVIPDIDDSPWLIDLKNKIMLKDQKEDGNARVYLKMRIDLLLKIMDKKVNISWEYRQGLVDTNATYQQVNEIGKYLFG